MVARGAVAVREKCTKNNGRFETIGSRVALFRSNWCLRAFPRTRRLSRNFLGFDLSSDGLESAGLVVGTSLGVVEVTGVEQDLGGAHGDGALDGAGQEVRAEPFTDEGVEQTEVVDFDRSAVICSSST